jgi:hypothetical protein
VRRAWWTVGEILSRDNQPELAVEVTRFVEQMPSAMTEREPLTRTLVKGSWHQRVRETVRFRVEGATPAAD